MTHDVVKTLLASCLCLPLVACGDDGGGEMMMVDPNTGDFHEYVLTELTLPNSGNAADYAFDVDGIDDASDNKLGAILGLLGSSANLQGSVDESIASGSLVLLSALRADALTADEAALWQVWLGENEADPPMTGDMFTVDPAGPTDAKVVGEIDASGVFEGSGGKVNLTLPLTAGVDPLTLTLYGAAIRVKVSEGEFTDASGADFGRLGGALREADVHSMVLPAIGQFVTIIINDDTNPADGAPDCACTGPGTRTCQNSSSGAAMAAGLLDTDEDCMVTTAELEANNALQSVLQPDVDLFVGDSTTFDPGKEGEEGYDSLSLGVGIKGVSAMFAH